MVWPVDLNPEQWQWFWDHGVCMDDWDYMLIVPADELEQNSDGEWTPKDYQLERMLQGCCDNTWYKVEFEDGTYGVGVAYHA